MPNAIDRQIPEAAVPLAKSIVRSVALSILLAKDFAPRSRAPATSELVGMELPRVLAMTVRVPGVRAALGGFAVRLDAPWHEDPAVMLRDYLDKLADKPVVLREATEFVNVFGHQDFVFGVLKYTRKPARATDTHMDVLVKEVAQELRVRQAEMMGDELALAYAAAHHDLVRV